MHKPLVVIIVALLSIVLVPSAYAACSVTYTFANGTTADATQVNQNFTDVTGCVNSSGNANGKPYLQVYLAGYQGSITSTPVKIVFDTVAADSGSYWDATNQRYKPGVAGRYSVCLNTLSATIGNLPAGDLIAGALIYKNGSVINAQYVTAQSTLTGVNINQSAGLCMLAIPMNGSTDYIEAFARDDASGINGLMGGAAITNMAIIYEGAP